MSTFVNILTFVTYTLCIIYVSKKQSGFYKIKTLIPLMIITAVNLLLTMLTGKKNSIIVFALVIICGLLMTKKISFKMVVLAAFMCAPFLQILQITSEMLSGREFFNRTYMLQYHAYRFDLSDLALTVSLNFGKIQNPLSIVKESLIYSIPSFLYQNKNLELIEYKNSIEAVGLVRDFDFNDTFFSMGAQVGGFLGIFLVFTIITLLFEWISWCLLSIKKVGLVILITILPFVASCESDWSMFISQTRDLIVIIPIAFVVYSLVLQAKKKQIKLNDLIVEA